MSLSITCIKQQEKDRRMITKFVAYGLLCSTILHAGVLTLAISGMLDRPLKQEEDAIELIFVEEALPEEEPEIVEEQDVIPPEPLETTIAQPQEIVPPEIPTEMTISETVESSSPEQPTETALKPIEQPKQLEPLPEPVATEPIAQPNSSAATFAPNSIAEVQPDSASTPETSNSFSAPIAANISPEVPKPQVAEATQPSSQESSSNLSSSLSEQSSFEDVASNVDNTETALSNPIETERSAPTKPSLVGTQPSASQSDALNNFGNFEEAGNPGNPDSGELATETTLSNPIDTARSAPTKPSVVGTQPSASQSNVAGSLSQQGNLGDVASNISNMQSSPSNPIETERSAPTKPSAVGTQPSASQFNVAASLSQQGNLGDVASNISNMQASPSNPIETERSAPTKPSAVGTQPSTSQSDTLNNLSNFEDAGNPGNPDSGELAAVGSPLQGSAGSRERPTKSSSGSGSSNDSNSIRKSCIKCPEPGYPSKAREEGLEGNPKLTFDIDSNGNVTNVMVEESSGHSILDEAAREEVERWKFDSTKVGGRLRVKYTFKFRLRN